MSAGVLYFFTFASGTINKIDIAGQGIKVDSIQILPWKHIFIKNLIYNKDGVEIYLPSLRLEWTIDSLLDQTIEKIYLTKLIVRKLPKSSKKVENNSKKEKIDIDSLLKNEIPISIKHIQIDDLQVLPFKLRLSLKMSQLKNKIEVKSLNLIAQDAEVNLSGLKLNIASETSILLNDLGIKIKKEKIVSLQKLNSKIILNKLINNQNLGQWKISKLAILKIPKSDKEVSSEPSADVETKPFDFEELKLKIKSMMPKELPVNLESFKITLFDLPFIKKSLHNIDISIKNKNKVSLSLRLKNQDKGELKTKIQFALKDLFVDIDLQIDGWQEDIILEKGPIYTRAQGKLKFLFKNFEDIGSKINLGVGLKVSQKDLVELTMPIQIGLNEGLFTIDANTVEVFSSDHLIRLNLASSIKFHENLDIDVNRVLLSDIEIVNKEKITIESILLESKIRNIFNTITSKVTIENIQETVSPIHSKISSIVISTVLKDLSKINLDLKVQDIQSLIFKIDSVTSQTVLTDDSLKLFFDLNQFSSEDMGILTHITLKSEGNLKVQSAVYSILGYKIKDSEYKEISGDISWKDNLLKGVTRLSYAELKPLDFMSFSNIPSKLKTTKDSETKSIESTEMTSLPFDFEWKIEPLKDQIIHIIDEQYKLDIQADILLKAPSEISGTLRILNGTLKYSDYDLKILDVGYLKFHKKEITSKKSLELSTTTTDLMAQLAHLSKQDNINQNFSLKDGVEVQLKLGMKWQEKDIVVKVTGIYPDIKIRLYDDSGKEIKGGFLGLLTGGSVDDASGDVASPDMSKLLGDQVTSMANSKVDNYFNDKFKKQGIKVKTNFVGGKKGIGVQKKIGKKILLDYYRGQSERDDSINTMVKIQYLLKGNASLYMRQDVIGTAEPEMSVGVERNIKY